MAARVWRLPPGAGCCLRQYTAYVSAYVGPVNVTFHLARPWPIVLTFDLGAFHMAFHGRRCAYAMRGKVGGPRPPVSNLPGSYQRVAYG